MPVIPLLGWPVLALAVALGVQVARRVLGERCPLVAGLAGPGLGLAAVLLASAWLLPWLSPGATVACSGVLFAGSLWLVRRWPAPPLEAPRLPWPVLALLGGLTLLVLVFSLFEQSVGMVTDGDFFVHAANLGLFARGWFPPRNPFLGTPMHGHFGRDLLISQLSVMTGAPWLEVEWIYTSAIQGLTFLLLFAWIRRATGSHLAGLLAAFMAFFAANLGRHVGLADILANNMATASLFLVLSSWAVLTALEGGGAAAVTAAGLVLGADALVYEVQFGLMALVLPVVSLLGRDSVRQRLGRAAAVLAVAGLVAATGGGTFTEMAGRLVHSPEGAGSGAEQRVTVRVPKERLLEIRYQNLRPSRAFETKFRPWGVDWKPSADYRPLWSGTILSVLWYPAWLLPFSLAFLLWRRVEAGAWFGLFAVASWLVPGVVDFGIWEGEAQRWLLGAAVGSAVALGVALGVWAGGTRGRARPWAWGTVALILWMVTPAMRLGVHDLRWALENPGRELPTGRPGVVPGTGLVPRPARLLEHHYGLSGPVLEAAAWLRLQGDPGQRFLSDDGDRPLNARGTVIGLAGRFPAMVQPPPPESTLNAGYEPTAAARAFWETGDPRRLDPSVAWLLLTREHPPAFRSALEGSGRFERAYRSGGVEVWRAR